MRFFAVLIFSFLSVSADLLATQVRVLIGTGGGEIFVRGKGLIDVKQSDEVCYSSPTGLVFYENRPYRGKICVVREGGNVFVVNELDIEDYLKGVLYNEVSHYWPMEVLKAQAVVARTYALYRIRMASGNSAFDLANDQMDQVYSGYNGERYRTNLAVEATRGEVLVCKGDKTPIPAFYHACCGGKTELPEEVWGGKATCGEKVVEDPFCKISPYFSWEVEFPEGQFISLLRPLGVRGSRVEYLSILSRTQSGRVKDLLLVTDVGEFVLSGLRLRMVLGPRKVRSTLFSVKAKGKKVRFRGRGWGHGVGMCQWGAYGMALRGYKYDQILRFYYPEAELCKM